MTDMKRIHEKVQRLIARTTAYLKERDRCGGLMGDGGGFIIFVMIFLVVFLFITQIETFNRTADAVRDSLCKGAAIAIKASIIDEYRRDYIARIDTSIAQTVFEEYVDENMNLTKAGTVYKQINNGATQYWFTIETATYSEGGGLPPYGDPKGVPEINITGKLYIPFSILPNLFSGQYVTIPYDIKAANSRIVYEEDIS